jgi:L-threonylcarbamoyladenylate synthase
VRRVRLEEALTSPEELSRLRADLARGGVAAIPTETFYGLAADPMNERGVARIFDIKARDDGKPLLVLFSSRDDLERLGVEAAPQLLDRFFGLWPAPLTVILALRAPIAASREGRTLALRIPADEGVRRLLEGVGPLTGTSANRSGEPPLCAPDQVAEQLGAELDFLIDGGRTPGGQPSTLVDATQDPPVVIRAGAFAWPPASQ